MLEAMPLFERDTRKHMDPPDEVDREAGHHTSASSGSNSAAEDSAAHIAQMVRRTAERNARPGPSSVRAPSVTALQHPMPAHHRPTPPQPVAQNTAAQPETPLVRAARRRPSLRHVAAGATVAALLIAGGFAATRPNSSAAKPTSPPAASAAPSRYAVKVTDVITDCAGHSHGKMKSSFENQNCVKATRSLATGQVRGRPALFVVSRIQMASVEAAASVKQVLDATGTGNLNDLLREGKTFPGAPGTMPRSGYASIQAGAVILVAETGFVDGGPSFNTNPALRAAAAQVAALVIGQG
ncbi:MAG: hypothetical protein QOF35_582 [Actinomycetota bacterium]|nr:hypothetical protein [Actinomycetota bacterium]